MADTKERSIRMTAPDVRATLAGTKTQTRLVVEPQPTHFNPNGVPRRASAFYSPSDVIHCPFGQLGDRLWVRETWRVGEDVGEHWRPGAELGDLHIVYDADGTRDYRSFPDGYQWPRNAKTSHNSAGTPEHWISHGPIPSIFMPRWASRITLEITDVRVERLQEISEADAIAEGWPHPDPWVSPCQWFADLWTSINGPGSWDANPWCWAISFRRLPQ